MNKLNKMIYCVGYFVELLYLNKPFTDEPVKKLFQLTKFLNFRLIQIDLATKPINSSNKLYS